jgi:diguanylate cyclase (GGDEF)-like protein
MAQHPTLAMERRAHPLVLLGAVLLVPLVAMMDYLAGPEFGFSIFYVIPVVIVAWAGSWTSSWATAVLSSLAWMIIDVLTAPLYSTVLAPLWNTLTRFAFFAFALVAVRYSQERLESAEMRALSDPLTGLPNRQYLVIMLQAARARLERYGKPLTLAYLDLDDFKRVNDRHGHQTGDRLLKSVAHVLVEMTRDTDTVARLGGDEFVMLLPEAEHHTAEAVLERVHEALNEIKAPPGTGVTYSIGACVFYRPLESAEAMVREADERMYRVKRAGKNSVTIGEVR